MSIDPARDATRWRRLLLASTLLLAGLIATVGVREGRRSWIRWQEELVRLGLSDGEPGVIQVSVGDGVERCTTCHLGEVTGEPGPQPFARHSEVITGHRWPEIGCTSCHGGTGRALEEQVAHSLVGTSERDPMMRQPHVQASCVTCHLPGEVEGAGELLRGADLYMELGCATCHPLDNEVQQGQDYGPPLRNVRRKGLASLTSSILEPGADYPETRMPSFSMRFSWDTPGLDALLVYVQALALTGMGGGRPVGEMRCEVCHAGRAWSTGGPQEHRCPYIVEHGELACVRCHGARVPDAGAGCPVLADRRQACPACHIGGGGA